MLRVVATIGAALIFFVVLACGFFGLKTWCSSEGTLPKFETPLKQDGGPASPEGEQAKPAATFDLRMTDQNKIEGRYYGEKADKEDWGHKFFCDIKIGEVLLAIFTLFLVIYTARLYWATRKLADADRPHIFPGHFSISGMKTGEPVTVGFNFENCGRSPAYLENLVFSAVHADTLPRRPDFKNAAVQGLFFGYAPGKILFPAPGGAKADIPLPPDVRTKVLDGKTTLFVYGRINFKETSGESHFQGFAYRYAPATDELFNCGPGIYWDHS
jgi:hypothetical protein